MAYYVNETLTLMSAVTTNSTNGSTLNFRAGRVCEGARWAVTGASSTNITVSIQTSIDGTNFAEAANSVNCGTATVTGTLTGPIPYIRATTNAGATPGTLTVKVCGILKP